VQELGGAVNEADGSVLEIGASEQNVAHLFAPLLRSMERLPEKLHINLNTPLIGRINRPAAILTIFLFIRSLGGITVLAIFRLNHALFGLTG
jgi:hypothetical protein